MNVAKNDGVKIFRKNNMVENMQAWPHMVIIVSASAVRCLIKHSFVVSRYVIFCEKCHISLF